MKRIRVTRPSVVLLASATLLSACGSTISGGRKKSTGPQLTSGSDATPSPAASYHFTASYTQRPLDVIIIRDGASHNYVIDQRLQAALPVLSARLWNLGAETGSVHVGVFDQYYQPNPNPAGPAALNTAGPIIDAKTPDLILASESMAATDWDAAIEARIGNAGTRGGDSRPATVFMATLAEGQKPNGGMISGLFRPNAFWAVLYITAGINPDDPYDVSDVTTAIQSHGSATAFSALTLPKATCMLDPTQNPPQQTNPNGDQQRNLELKLQAATNGVSESVCTNTYALFVDNFANAATGTQYFEVTLPNALKADSIVITADKGAAVKDFSYVPGSTTLEVSTLVTSGEGFTVSGTPDATVTAAVTSTDPGDPTVPTAGQTTLSPAEQAFLTTVNPVLQKDCATCHNGRPFDTSGGYASAEANKGQIASYIQLPATDPNHMPQGGTLSATDLQTILTWATSAN